jgi:hypothetical protein
MNPDVAYIGDIIHQVERIRARVPADLALRFGNESGLAVEDFSVCTTDFNGTIAAVDGSNSMVLESGSFSVAAVRAAVSCFFQKRRASLGRTSIRLVGIGGPGECTDFAALYEECFAGVPGTGIGNEDRSHAAAIVRDTLEYASAIETVGRLKRGDVLLLDGSLRVSHASHLPVLRDLLKKAGSRGVLIGAVTKQTQLTWDDGHPLVTAVNGWAEQCGIAAPWFIRIPESLPDGDPHRQWERGAVYVAKLHQRSRNAFKIEIPDYADGNAVQRTFAACATYADDGRIPGYPFPLMDAHRMVCISEDVTGQIRQDLIRGIHRLGMDWHDYEQLFGDYHEEFARY